MKRINHLDSATAAKNVPLYDSEHAALLAAGYALCEHLSDITQQLANLNDTLRQIGNRL